MIEAVQIANAHLFGDALAAQYRLRYRIFVERSRWDVPSYRGMEYDSFDTPAAVYLIWRDSAGTARGITRLLPTTCPYMIKDLWPNLIGGQTPPSQPDIWEATRFGVDRQIGPRTRTRVIGELVCGGLEYGLWHGIKSYLCVMPEPVIRHVLIGSGCQVELCGEPISLGIHRVVAGRIFITEQSLARVRRHHGIAGPVLSSADEQLAKAA